MNVFDKPNLLTPVNEESAAPYEFTLTVTFYAGSIEIAEIVNDAVVRMIGTANIVPPAKPADPWAEVPVVWCSNPKHPSIPHQASRWCESPVDPR
jgi:hypothetical protein